MIAIENTLVSEDILEKKFVCDLNACKGACCVEGDYGAPLDEEEIPVLEAIYEDVKPYMGKDGIKAIEKQGISVKDDEGNHVTTLVKGKHCAFVIFDTNGIAKCAIEAAHADGKVTFKKPISCHLYPVRINRYKNYDAVNYHQWKVCKPACSCGKKLDVPVYKFLRGPLVRKYGENWYKQLETAAGNLPKK